MISRSPRLLSFRIGSIFLLLFSIFCTQVPLFNYLGFEFSALTSVIASFIGGLVTIALWRSRPAQDKFAPHQIIVDSSQASLLLLLIPFSIMSLNALVVKNCDYAEGAGFFVLINVPAVLFSNAVALTICMVVRRWWKTAFTFIFVLVLFHIVYVTFTGPQIFAFNPIMGFFPGLTYDESLNAFSRLALYRIETLSLVFLLWIIIVAAEKRRRSRAQWREILTVQQRGGGVVLALVVAGFIWFGDDIGLSSSEAHIRKELGSQLESEHFVVAYPAAVKHSRAREILNLHEFFFERISADLRVAPRRKIHSFLYVSARQKGMLVGAARTNISKPWLWQIHINLDDVESSLKHEIVHVMAAEFGFPLLRIGPNSGLIEGLAVAVERMSADAPIHLAAAQILAVGIHPNMESLFSVSGFMKAHPGVSYTLAGSFCRFLIDQYGLRRFKRVYRSGDFPSAYNKNFSSLVGEWRRHLSKFPVKETEKQRAEYLFKRPSIFGKECARTIAELNTETREMFVRKDYAGALASANKSLERSPNVEAIFQKVNSLFRLRQYQEAVDFAETKLKDSTIVHALLPIFLVIGDSHWAIGNRDRALQAYQLLLSIHVSLGIDEACAVRLESMFHPVDSENLQPYFIEDMSDSARIEFLRAKADNRKVGIIQYLLGRELNAKERFGEAIQVLSGKWRMELPVLEFLRQRRIGRLFLKIGEYEKAKLHFWDSLNYVSNEAYVLEIGEMLKFCDWLQVHTDQPNL